MISWLTKFALKQGLSAGIAGWIGPLIYVLIAAAIFSSGWFVRDKMCDAAFYKAENARLEARLEHVLEQNRKLNEAAKEDQDQATKDAEAIDQLAEKLKELTDGLPANDVPCLDAGTVDRLRKLWE